MDQGAGQKRRSGVKPAVAAVAGSLIGIAVIIVVAVTVVLPFVGEQDLIPVEGHLFSYNVNDGIRLQESETYYLIEEANRTAEFEDAMSRMRPGTALTLYTAGGPTNDDGEKTMYAYGVTARDTVLLETEAGLKAANAPTRHLIFFLCLLAFITLVNAFYWGVTAYAEKKRADAAESFMSGQMPTAGVRREAETGMRHRVLATAANEEYQLCFRRVKSVTELVVNGRVYDEKKGFMSRFPHALFAVVDGHRIEAGMDLGPTGNRTYYILFDGQQIYRTFGYRRR